MTPPVFRLPDFRPGSARRFRVPVELAAMIRIASIRPLLFALVLCGAFAAPGCSKKSVSLVAPPVESPVVDATFPPARAERVSYDTGIWIQFREPLDLATVNTANLFFKLDTRRFPISLQWDGAANRLRIVPQVPLELRRTYTVEITNRVRTVSGRIVGDPFFWQFTTNSLRRLAASIPSDGATWESPFAMIGWDSTETAAGAVEYSIWSGQDSQAVAARTGLPAAVSTRGFWIPRARWASGAPTFWNVRAENLETGETDEGPTWRFDVVPADTPVDTVTLYIADWGSWTTSGRGRLICQGTLYAGPLQNNAFYWNLSRLGPEPRLAGENCVFNLTYSENYSQYQSAIVPIKTYFSPCIISQRLPEAEEREVAYGTRSGSDVTFSTVYFAAHLEAMARYGRVWGYNLRASNYSLHGVGTGAIPSGRLQIYRYRIPPGAQAPASLAFANPRAPSIPPAGSRLPFAREDAAAPLFTRP